MQRHRAFFVLFFVFLLLCQQVISMLVVDQQGTALPNPTPASAVRCCISTTRWSVIVTRFMFTTRGGLLGSLYVGISFCFFLWWEWESLESVLFLLLFICILGRVLLVVLLLGYLIVVKNCWMWHSENNRAKDTRVFLSFFPPPKKSVYCLPFENCMPFQIS